MSTDKLDSVRLLSERVFAKRKLEKITQEALGDLIGISGGYISKIEKQPVMIIWSNRMRTAQRKPVMQTKMRNVITGKVYEYSFKFGESIEEADVVREKANFLYADAEGTHFMNGETFETVDIAKEASRKGKTKVPWPN